MGNEEAAVPDIMLLTADIVAAHVSNNSTSAADLPVLIRGVHAALSGLRREVSVAPDALSPSTGAVSVRKSLADPNFLISMIDGKPYKALKRHLTAQGLTPAEYRARYGLREDYPMVAPAYSERRSAFAKALGLGTKRKTVKAPKAAIRKKLTIR